MLDPSLFKSITRKHKKFKVMEIKNWEQELDEKVDFGYFTYQINDTTFIHIMLIIVFTENQIEIEFIHQQKDNQELEEIKTKIHQILLDRIHQQEGYNNIQITNTINRERFKKYVLTDERLKKKMERYIKE